MLHFTWVIFWIWTLCAGWAHEGWGFALNQSRCTQSPVPVLISSPSPANPLVSNGHGGANGHGSVRFLTDGAGAVTDTYAYDAYGILLSTTGSTVNPYRYTGEQWDSDLGMYYLRARYYKPETGRFWTMDSYEGDNEDPASLHKYIYCHGNPVNGIDPSGHDLSSLCISMYVQVQLGTATFLATHGAIAETAMFVTALSFVNSYQQLNAGVDEYGQPLTTLSASMLWAGMVGDLLPVGKAVRVAGGSVIRKVILKPLKPGWGLTKAHLQKHFFGNSATALKNIDPKGNADKWAQHLTELFNAPVTKTTSNGMLDIVKEFPKEGGGTFKMGVRLSPKSDGTFDLITMLTDQSKM